MGARLTFRRMLSIPGALLAALAMAAAATAQDEPRVAVTSARFLPAAAAPGSEAGPALANELIQFCRAQIAHYKCPRTIDFVTELPRTETGKMQKRKLRDRYWQGRTRRI